MDARSDCGAGLLLPLLVVALVFCHGFFGGLHLVSGPSSVGASADGDFVGGHAQHVGVGSSDGQGEPRDSAPHLASDYAAVLLAAFGAALGLLLGAALRRRRFLVAAPRGSGFVPVAEVPVLARGPDHRALLQVFRL